MHKQKQEKTQIVVDKMQIPYFEFFLKTLKKIQLFYDFLEI